MTAPRIFMALLLALTTLPLHRSEARQNAYYEEDYQEEAPSDDASVSNDEETDVVQRRDAGEDNGERDSDRDRRSERPRRRKKKTSQMERLKQFHYTTGKIEATTQGRSSRGR